MFQGEFILDSKLYNEWINNNKMNYGVPKRKEGKVTYKIC